MSQRASGALRRRMLALLLLSVAVAIGVALLPRFPQPSSYHDFADQRTMWGVPHALNVFSNLGFLLVGALGLHRLHLLREGDRSVGDARPAYRLFLLSIVAVAFGSAYYHLEPNHERLFWDRLPMSLAFMSLLTCVLVERLGAKIGMRLFPWLAVAGPLSVVYWLFSERAGGGDLRPYAVVHFYSVLLILMVLALFPARWTRGGDFLVVLALYGAALASERLDHEIDAATGWISGHSLKHVFAALAAGWVIRMLRLRRPVSSAAGRRAVAGDDIAPRGPSFRTPTDWGERWLNGPQQPVSGVRRASPLQSEPTSATGDRNAAGAAGGLWWADSH